MNKPTAPPASLRQRLARLSPAARAHLAAALRSAPADAADPSAPPLSYQQRNFWLLHQMADDPSVYNSLLMLRLTGPLDAEALQEALLSLARDYRIFRTVYVERGGTIEGLVREGLRPEVAIRTWGGGAGTFERGVAEALEQETRRPFALDRESPFRAYLYGLDGERHVLGIVFHHIASDGGAQNRFWRALKRRYEALRRGHPPPPPPPEAQYDQFTQRQRLAAHGPREEELLRYWLAALDGAPGGVDFVYDHPSGSGERSANSEVVLPLGDVEARVSALARAENATRHVVYLAAYFAWLYHHVASTDLTVGVPIEGRTRLEDDGVLGCCINMLSIRQQLDPEGSFRSLLRQTREVMVAGIAHADMPFIRLVEELEHAAGQAFGFYNTAFQYRNFIGPFPPLGDCRVEHLRRPAHLSQFPLMLEVHPLPQPHVALVYQSDLFRRPTVERLLHHYRALVESALDAPDRPLAELRLMDAEERALVVRGWARNARPYRREATVHELFGEQAEQRPEATALLMGDERMTYGALDHHASAVAAALQRRGVAPGQRVGLCLERSLDLIVGLLAVLKCGAAYVPLDPEYPPARLRLMVADADLATVLTTREGGSRLRHVGAEPLVIEDLRRERGGAWRAVEVPATAPAYLMYTSGTTGQPKGVLIPHRGVVRLVRGADYVQIEEDDTFLQLSSPSFDAATFEIWGPLLNGARLALMPPITPSIRDIGEAIRRYGVTTLWLTAGLFHLVVDEDVGVLRPLRHLLAGGDVLSPAHVRACLDACPGLHLVNGYGPTENTTFSTCYPVPREGVLGDRLPIGRPIANSEAYVLDDQLRPAPIGVPGDLYLGGDGLAIGYWRRPDLTRERFVPHPFAAGSGARLYRSGDRARFLPDGTLDFLGRRDRQVKVRGFRIELGEVEAAVAASPAVRQCVVVAGAGAEGLTAYVVPAQQPIPEGPLREAPSAHDALDGARAAARERLPTHMMPNRWVALDALPLTPNGKVDRRALPHPAVGTDTPAGSSAEGEPRTQLEWRLLEIWRRLFHSDAVTCTDDFFDLGGSSLLAIRFVAEAERCTRTPVALTQLFQHPTIRTLAQAMTGGAASLRWTSLVPLAPQGTRPPLFIAHGWAGDVFVFRSLAQSLGAEQPVYGLQAVEHAGGERHRSVEAMAAHYVSEIRSVQPAGPYYLFGFSIGGMIAYEIARQLWGAGERVGMLFALDTHPTNLPPTVRLRASARFLWRRGLERLATVVRDPRRGWPLLREGPRAARARFSPGPTSPREADASPFVVPAGADYYQAVGQRYVPRPCPIPVTVLQAADSHYDQRVAWSHLAPRALEVVPVASRHVELLTGSARQEVAATVRERLAQAQREADR